MIIYVTKSEYDKITKICIDFPNNEFKIAEAFKQVLGQDVYNCMISVLRVKLITVKDPPCGLTRVEIEKGESLFPVDSLTF